MEAVMLNRTKSRPWRGNKTILRATPLALIFLLIEFFDELAFGMQSAVMPSLRIDLDLTYAQIGLLLGLPGVLSTVIEPVILLFGDTPLRKRLVIGGGLVMAISLILISSASSFEVILVAFIAIYPASGAFVTLSQATLMDLNPGREPHMMARWTVAGSGGNLIGPLLASAAFALGLGWRWLYLGLACFAAGLVLGVLPRKFPDHPRPGSHRAENSGLDISALLRSIRLASKERKLWRWLVLLELSDLLLDVFTGYSALYFADVVGFTPAQVGLVFGLIMAASLVTDIAVVALLERYPGRSIVRVSASVAALLYPAWLLAPWPLAKVVLAVAIRIATIGWYPILQGEAYAALPGRSGTVTAFNSITGILGSGLVWVVGVIATYAGLQTAMWLLLLGPVSLAFFVPRKGQETHVPRETTTTIYDA
jgi:FSR family fosmidomycin resistance protein-like MFS transporter